LPTTTDLALPVSRPSLAIAAASTIIEWYDFTLYLYLVTILSRAFFGGTATGIAATLAGFALAYLMRPLGALVFGHVGDRYGRRTTMLASMSLMTAAMLATAFLPTRDAIGPAAGGILIALRCVMAFAVGGEYTGVVAYLIESAPAGRRGLITSLAAAASEVGALLAAGVSAALALALTPDALDSWGWRIAFVLGALMAGIVLIARMHLQETPEFERQRAEGSIPANPVRQVLSRNLLPVARGFAISALGSISYYVGITYVPTLLISTGVMAEDRALVLATLAAVVVIAVTPFVGLASDRFGRRPVLLAVTLLCVVLPVSLFAAMSGASFAQALAAAIVLAALGGAFSAVGAVTTAELLPGEGRLSGLALGTTAATALFGGLTPYLAQRWIDASGLHIVPGIMIACVALALLPVLWWMPETRPMQQDRAD
jgi:MHS family proline/betaine transporter-like MFS transporter